MRKKARVVSLVFHGSAPFAALWVSPGKAGRVPAFRVIIPIPGSCAPKTRNPSDTLHFAVASVKKHHKNLKKNYLKQLNIVFHIIIIIIAYITTYAKSIKQLLI